MRQKTLSGKNEGGVVSLRGELGYRRQRGIGLDGAGVANLDCIRAPF